MSSRNTNGISNETLQEATKYFSKDFENIREDTTFKGLFSKFISGTPIKRDCWKGYWKYHYGRIDMYSKDGTITNFCETKDLLFTISNITENDWQIATPENSILE